MPDVDSALAILAGSSGNSRMPNFFDQFDGSSPAPAAQVLLSITMADRIVRRLRACA